MPFLGTHRQMSFEFVESKEGPSTSKALGLLGLNSTRPLSVVSHATGAHPFIKPASICARLTARVAFFFGGRGF